MCYIYYLIALRPLSSCIYTTLLPTTLSKPIYIHLFTIIKREFYAIKQL
jgi:hypothetical protein